MADEPPKVIEINVSDVITVSITPPAASASAGGVGPVVVITEAQRSMLERVLKKVLASLSPCPAPGHTPGSKPVGRARKGQGSAITMADRRRRLPVRNLGV